MPGIGLPVEARPDWSSFKQVGDQAERMMTAAGDRATHGFAKALSAGAKDVQKATSAYTKAYDSVADASGRAAAAESQRQQLQARGKTLSNEVAAAEKKLADALNAEEKDVKAVAAATRDLERAKDAQARNNTAVIRSAESATRSRREEIRQTREAVSAYRELENAQRRAAAPGFNRSFNSYDGGGQGLLSGIASQSSGIVGQFQSLGGNSGRSFIAGAGAAILAGGLIQLGSRAAGMVLDGFKSVMDTGIDFSRTVNNFQGVTQSSATQTQQMSSAARALGSDITLSGASASDAALSMTELAKAGFSVDEAITAARGSLELATAGQIGAAQASEIQANAINAFKLNATDAARVADVLANAAVGSSADIPDIALALQQVGGIANGFGEDINGTVGALMMLANAGVKGSDAGTLLKTTLQSITDQGNPAQAAIEALGLSLYNFDTGQFVGFRELFRQLDEAKARMSPEQFQAQTNILFGSDAMRAPMLGNIADYDAAVAKTQEIGTAANMAKAQMQGWPGVVEGVSNSMEGLKLSLFDMFNSPAGQDFGQKIVAAFDGIGEWVSTHKPEIIGFFTAFVSGTATAADAFLTYVARMLDAGSYLQEFLSHTFGNLIEAMGKSAEVAGSVIKHIPGFKSVGEGIQGAGQAVAGMMDNWQQVGQGMRDVAGGIDTAREGIRGLRDDFTGAMRATQESESRNRFYADSFKQIQASIEAVPGTKEFVLTDNTGEVQQKLQALGFAVNQLPDGRLTVHIEYRDQAGRLIDPAQLLGYNPNEFGSAGEAQQARRGGTMGQGRNSTPWVRNPGTVTPTPPAGGWPAMSAGGGGGGGGGGSEDPAPYFDPSQWQVDPGASSFVPTTGPGGFVDSQEVQSAQDQLTSTAESLSEAKLRLLELEADTNVKQSTLIAAKNNVAQLERKLAEDQAKVAEAMAGTTGKMSREAKTFASGLGEIGASLDADLGISDGLPGIADNLVRFIASLAAAPLLGPLSAISKANGDQGSGLMGMLASNGAFGPQFVGGQQDGYSASGMGPAGLRGAYSFGAYAGDAALLANVPAGRYTQGERGDLTQGLADCSSAVEDLVNLMDGRPTGGASMSTGNAADWLTARGFLPGAGGPGDMRVAFNPSHMQATLPGGTPFNWGSPAAAARGGVGGSGADDPALTSRYYRPVSAAPMTAAPMTGATPWAPGAGAGTPGLFSPENTNPALTPPLPGLPGTAAPGMGLTGAPTAAPFGMPGTAPTFGPQGATGGATAGAGIGATGVPFTAMGGGGFQGLGGMPMEAMMGAAGAADMVMPGAGAAAQMGMKLANRTIGYMGQLAGIGVSGLMETLLPAGSEKASKGWIPRIAAGFSGAKPAIPNMAGGQAPPQPTNGQGQGQQGGQNVGTNIEKLEYNNHQATEDRAGADLTNHLTAMNSGPGW